MEIVEKGFVVNYEIQKMGLIKVGGSGEYQGRAYSASLKIRCSNLTRENDNELGEIDKEELVEFKIPCDSNTEAGELNKLFRSLKLSGVIINFNGVLPMKNDNSEFLKVTVLDSPKNLMQKYHKDMSKKTDIKAS